MRRRLSSLTTGAFVLLMGFVPRALSAPAEPSASCTVAGIAKRPLYKVIGEVIGVAPMIGLSIVLVILAVLAMGVIFTKRAPTLFQKVAAIIGVLILLGVVWQLAIAFGAGGDC
jgi:hypothetical protein